jgi:hypothetical protein
MDKTAETHPVSFRWADLSLQTKLQTVIQPILFVCLSAAQIYAYYNLRDGQRDHRHR